MKEFIGTGKTIEEAMRAAKIGLNAPLTAEVKTEIIAMPKKKVLGLFGGSDAKVKASYEEEQKPVSKNSKRNVPDKKPKRQEPKKTAPAKKEAPKPEHKPQKKERVTVSAEEIDLDYVCGYIRTIVDSFNIEDAKITAQFNDGVIEATIECENYGIIIGHRGETLDAIQYLTSLAVKNTANKYVRVTINVGNYRAKREETLRALAAKQANFVARTGRRYGFEPMNPYERRVIHTAVSEIDGVVSRSIGNGTSRRVLLEPEGGVRTPQRRGGRPRSSAPRRTNTPDPNREKKVDRADVPKFGKIEVNKD